MRFRKASIFSGVPVISTVKLSVETSIILHRNTSTQLIMSERSLALGTFTFIKASSRMTKFPGSSSLTLRTSICFATCLTTWSIVFSSPLMVMVIRDMSCCWVGPTVMLSMLKFLRRNRFAIVWRTPGLFSTKTLITLVFPFSISSHLSVVVNRSLEAQREQHLSLNQWAHRLPLLLY